MNVKVLFEEISNYVAKHYYIRPQLKYVDDKTIDVSYSPGRFFRRLRLRSTLKRCARMSCACLTSVAMQ